MRGEFDSRRRQSRLHQAISPTEVLTWLQRCSGKVRGKEFVYEAGLSKKKGRKKKEELGGKSWYMKQIIANVSMCVST